MLETNKKLCDDEMIHRAYDVDGSLIAKISADSKEFSVLDVQRDPRDDADYIIVDEEFNLTKKGASGQGYKGIWLGEPVMIGRVHHKERFNYPSTVSRDHFKIELSEQELVITNFVHSIRRY